VLVRGYRRVSVLFTVWSYAVLAPMGFAAFAVLSVVWRRDPVARARRLQRMTSGAYRVMHDWLWFIGLVRFDHRCRIAGIPEGPCVVIANHPTMMDITAISAVLGGGCTIVKPELYGRRGLHGMLSSAGHMQGPGSDLVSIRRVVDEAVLRLGQGFRVVVFPEGTRSREGRLGPFGRAPFEMACRAGVPLVSLTVVCEPPYLSKEVPLHGPQTETADLRLGLLSVDDPSSMGIDSRTLRRDVESRYHAWMGRSVTAAPVYDPPPKESPCPITSKTS